jgi:hypothetical protein
MSSNKLYLFGIGGTGSRVLKSLTMLLASGVECGVDTIVPIIIDRDTLNEDLTRTKLLIDDYIAVNKIAEKTKTNRFCKTKIKKLDGRLELALQGEAKKFDEFITISSMSDENKALVKMLFSAETLDLDMTAGFQGNPNIGSVVLNQFDDNDLFKTFSNDFQDGDKIFIISSIFGGTGASGFPLLVKILNEKIPDADKKGLNNWGLINKAPKGAVSVLPYFQVGNSNDSLVNSDTFIDKTKAALSYYKTLKYQLDTLYYVADKTPSTFEHHKGGSKQRNDAHFIEMVAALAILDFVNTDKSSENIHQPVDERNKVSRDNTTYGEYGFLPDKGQESCAVIDFSHLGEETTGLLIESITRFALFCKYMGYSIQFNASKNKYEVIKSANSVFDTQYEKQPYCYSLVKLAKSLTSKESVKRLLDLQAKFYEWLMEMNSHNHSRKFYPLNLEKSTPFDFVKGNMDIVAAPNIWDKIRLIKNWARVDNELNKQIHKTDKALKADEHFLEVFYRAAELLINFNKK